jgi:hypothetical protein
MALYQYIDDDNGRVYDVVQGMNEVHEFFVEGKKLRRVFFPPQTAIDTRCDAHSAADFVKVTNKRGGTIGELMDRAKELSEKRGGVDGDPIARKHYDKYKTSHDGKDHPDVLKSKRKERLKKLEKTHGLIVSDK